MQNTRKKLLAGGVALSMTLATMSPAFAEPQDNESFASPEVGSYNYGTYGHGYNRHDGYRNHNRHYNHHDDDDDDGAALAIGAILALGLLGVLAASSASDDDDYYDSDGYGHNNWNNNWGHNNWGWGSGYGSGYHNNGARNALNACERKAERVNWNRGGNGFEWTEVYDIDRLNNGAYRVQARGISKYPGPDRYVDVTCKVRDGYVTRFNARPT